MAWEYKEMKLKPGRQPANWTLEKILENTEKSGDCMLWKGGTHSQGYGMIRYQTIMRTVHSVVAQLKYNLKEAPGKYSGKRVTRTCDNLRCCNPDHIYIIDAWKLQRGSAAYRCRFTQEQIADIRHRYDTNYYWGIIRDLSKEYDASEGHMSAICRRHIYKKYP
jgi:hypothetical protein